MAKLPKELVLHMVARVCGVEETDSKIAAANKVIETMRDAGFAKRDIDKAIALRDAAIKRGVT